MNKSTKIISTIGPSSQSEKIVCSLFEAGTDIFRLNFSHGTRQEHQNVIKIIRKIEKEKDLSIAIIADLQGPKYRIGKIHKSLFIEKGNLVNFHLNKPLEKFSHNSIQNEFHIHLPHSEIFSSVMPNENFLVNDGKLEFKIKSVTDNKIIAEALNSGPVESNKGINLPTAKLKISSLTKKDKIDLKFAEENDLDFVALSFVQKSSDILEAKSLIKKDTKIIAKIEKPSAIDDIDNIIQAADALMIARGDLGVELPPQELPAIQKRIILKSRKIGKPVIVATQMLESMIELPMPTRAEASDVAGAVFEGADAIMLSAETAIGKNPVKSVKMMSSIAKSAENHIKQFPGDGPTNLQIENSIYHAVAQSTVNLAETINASLIIAFTASGNTALRIARERPQMPIYALSPSTSVNRKLKLVWGTVSSFQEEIEYNQAIVKTIDKVFKEKFVKKGDNVIIVSGLPFGLIGSTNTIRVAKI